MEQETIALQLDHGNVGQLLQDLVDAGRIDEDMSASAAISTLSGDDVITRKLMNLLGNGRALIEGADYQALKVRDVISGQAGHLGRL